jgi:hypothetical protein
VALIAQLPPARMGDVPLEEISARAPALCAQALRALTGDADLALLTGRGGAHSRDPGPALGLARLAGARDAAGAALAAEALRGVLWESLLAEMGRVSAREFGDVSDRLAHVCACALAAALEDDAVEAPGGVAPAGRAPADAPGSASPRPGVQIVDELEPAERGGVPSGSGLGEARAQIEIRDQRARPGPSAWIATIGERLEAFRRDCRPFSVLLIEPLEPAALGRTREPAGLNELADLIERRLAAELASDPSGPPGVLTREAPGRWWVLSAESDRAGAEALAARLAGAAGEIADGLGNPVRLAVGTALCPVDGREPAALAAHADVGLYASRSSARAAGRRVVTAADDVA